ncbi:MAG: efflux RND transporter permease subunit, partial [Acidobacteria bacterium]|nr:efflux RND transporter permease subunit [Acidobacteriota bacterium]
AIPFSMLITFTALELSGTTLNIVVLFSLVLAVGMLVDNAVVVIENIYRHMQEGADAPTAAAAATQEVGSAILVSTLTTVGAFVPLVFWPGVIGDFMSYLPITVSGVLLASLLIAFTLNPAICAAFMKVPAAGMESKKSFLGDLGARFEGFYGRSLAAALRHRARVLLVTLGGFAAVFILYGGPLNTGVEFLPDTEPNQVFVNVETPPGTRLERTDEALRSYEEKLTGLPNLKVMAAGSGVGSQSDPLGLGGGGGSNPTRGRITLDLADRQDRTESSFDTLAEVRRRAASQPGVLVDVDRPSEGPPVGAPLSLELRGEDFETLGAIAARIRRIIEDIPGLVSLDDDFDLARPEVRLQVNRVEAARLGLTTAKIARTVRTAVNGTKASVYRWGDDEADVVVRLPAQSRTSLDVLGRLPVFNESGEAIPLNAVARLERTAALTSITHKNQQRLVTVSGRVTSPKLAAPVRAEAQRRLQAVKDLLPPGYTLSFGGQSEDEAETQEFLSRAFLYSLLIVLALMVAKFDSLTLPLIIMTAVAMSMIGVLLALIVTGLPFGIIMTGLGVISLAGIVVNNAIVLLDYGEQQRLLGVPREELVLATGLRRMRPVLLTAITTILGLIPLASGIELDFLSLSLTTGGESSQWWRSMAVAVIFGLAFATFLTLIVVPVLYDLLLESRQRRAAKHSDEA